MRAIKPGKTKTCAHCRHAFAPDRPMQAVCGPACAVAHARQERERGEKKQAQQARAEIRAAKAKLKSRSDYLKDAQTAFNAWVRERDHALPCVSCGRHHKGQWHAGHYRTVGANPELRFEPDNCHKQCAPCNNHKSGDLVNYRITILSRIGAERLAWLEGPHSAKKYGVDELKALIKHYRAETRKLIKAREGVGNVSG